MQYKDIERDIANETDLVKVITRLLLVAMIKGCIIFLHNCAWFLV